MLDKVRLVEVEIHSKCNRKCVWCPNYKIDRTKKIELDENLYLDMLSDLKFNGFKGTITYSRYNEPMLDIKLLKKRVRQAKGVLGDVKLVTNTNGDFLSNDNLDGLLIDELSIMDYDNKGLEYGVERLERLGVGIESISGNYIYGFRGDMRIVYVVNWTKNALLEDRGGYLDDNNSMRELKWKNNKELRFRPCYEPLYFIGIDYTGDVTPCCHIRGDNPNHNKYILGNLKNNSIDEIYNGNIANGFRNNRMREFEIDEMSVPLDGPCTFCQKDAGRYTRAIGSLEY